MVITAVVMVGKGKQNEEQDMRETERGGKKTKKMVGALVS